MIPVVVGHEFLLACPDAVIVDVRWYLDGRDGRAAYEAGHIPGAIWADLDRDLAAEPVDPTNGRHPLPTPQAFAAAMTRLGIDDRAVVVAYDDSGGVTAGRLVVMLRMLGRDAAVLDGGLMSWSGPVHSGWVEPATSSSATANNSFTPAPWPINRLASADHVEALTEAGKGVVLDARSLERFTGEVTLIDPRPGHIPGARSAPWASVLGPDGRFRSPRELLQHFIALGVVSDSDSDNSGDVVAYCGSGVSTCLNVIAMEYAGLAAPRLYVASWSGWSADPARPVATGG